MNKVFEYWNVAERRVNEGVSQLIDKVDSLGFTRKQVTLFATVVVIVLPLLRRLVKKLPQRQRTIYVKDFCVFTSQDPKTELSNTDMLTLAREKYDFDPEQNGFLRRISNNGLGPRCSIPPNLLEKRYTIEDAREEAAYVMFPTIQKLFEKTGLKPTDIDVLVTNCSLFCPTPSLSAMIINKFKMKHSIHNFSLGGMGCSAGPCGIDLIYHFMQQKKYKYALHVSTENITQNFYTGKNRSMLLPNALFRIGCSAVLITNQYDNKCKYKITNLVRTHIGANEQAYRCIFQTQDEQGNRGVYLARTITSNAIKCLTLNMKTLFVQILPLHVKLEYVSTIAATHLKWLWDTRVRGVKTTYPAPVMPRIERVIDNFCFHTGGRGVIDGMQGLFKLSDDLIEASRAALYRYGNTSSASIWYELAYHETVGAIKRGNKIWQIAFGSGFKANSLVLKSLKTLNPKKSDLISWFDEQDKEWRYNNSMVPEGWVQEPEKSMDYEALWKEKQAALKEKEWEEVKEKWMDRIQQELGQNKQ